MNTAIIDQTQGDIISRKDFKRQCRALAPLSQIDFEVLEMLKKYVIDGSNITTSTYMISIDGLYQAMRLNKSISATFGDLPRDASSDAVSKPKSKHISKADMIREANLQKKLAEETQKFISGMTLRPLNDVLIGKIGAPIEILVLGFLRHLKNIGDDVSNPNATRDLICGGSKFLNMLRTFTVRNYKTNELERPHPLIISDLEFCLDNLKTKSKFSILKTMTDSPQSLFVTPYDKILPNVNSSLFDTQQAMIDSLCAKKDILILLKSMTGDGKTSLCAILSWIAVMWNRGSTKHHVVLICLPKNLDPVSKQIQQNAAGTGVAYGVAALKEYADKPPIVKIRKHPNCKKNPMVMIIADGKSTIDILKTQLNSKQDLEIKTQELTKIQQSILDIRDRLKRINLGMERFKLGETRAQLVQSIEELVKAETKLDTKIAKINQVINTQYILCCDEPTVGFDIPNSPMIDYFAKLLSMMPRYMIMMSATLPKLDLLEEQFMVKYPQGSVKIIESSIVRIGRSIANFEGQGYVPHGQCLTISQFEGVVEKIVKSPLLQSMYTISALLDIWRRLKIMAKKHDLVLTREDDPKIYLDNISNMNQDAICKLVIKYFQIIIDAASMSGTTIHDGTIRKFCSSSFAMPCPDLNTFARSHSLRSTTLIVDADPIKILKLHFGEYIDWSVDIIAKANGFEKSVGFDLILQKIQTDKQTYSEDKAARDKSKSKLKSKSKSRSDDGGDDERCAIDSNDSDDELEPKLLVPNGLIIGSCAYMQARHSVSSLNSFNPSLINWSKLDCLEILKAGLCLGIGLYGEHFDSSYKSIVLDLASKGMLAYIISTPIISYGTNLPIENIFINETCFVSDSMAKTSQSVNTILQLFGRAGRPNKSYVAQIWAHDKVLDIVKNFVNDPTFVDIEVINMNKALYRSVLNPMIEKMLLRIKKYDSPTTCDSIVPLTICEDTTIVSSDVSLDVSLNVSLDVSLNVSLLSDDMLPDDMFENDMFSSESA
jgi:hypothetical protein